MPVGLESSAAHKLYQEVNLMPTLVTVIFFISSLYIDLFQHSLSMFFGNRVRQCLTRPVPLIIKALISDQKSVWLPRVQIPSAQI